MAPRSLILILSIMLASCCTHRESVASSVRHCDTVAELRSISARQLHSETVWETIIMRQDTAGRLVPVSREITRRTHTERENTADTSRSEVKAEAVAEEKSVSTETASPSASSRDKTPGWVKALVFLLVFVTITFGIFAFHKYLEKKWQSMN